MTDQSGTSAVLPDLRGKWAVCSRGRIGRIDDRQHLLWGESWTGTGLDGTQWASRNPTLICESDALLLEQLRAAESERAQSVAKTHALEEYIARLEKLENQLQGAPVGRNTVAMDDLVLRELLDDFAQGVVSATEDNGQAAHEVQQEILALFGRREGWMGNATVKSPTTATSSVDIRDIPRRDEFHAAIEDLLEAHMAAEGTRWDYAPDVNRYEVAEINYKNMLASAFDALETRDL
jgi:hypothetical protein